MMTRKGRKTGKKKGWGRRRRRWERRNEGSAMGRRKDERKVEESDWQREEEGPDR
jgi:hypothetical protein